MDTGDTSFMLVCSAMVMLMVPGLALFYGGMVRAKNVLTTMLQSFFMLGLATVVWAVLGYSLAFGTDVRGFVGGLDFALLRGVGPEPKPELAKSVPHLGFMAFQAMFAVITPALVTGAFAERVRFAGLCAFFPLWCLLVYAPVAHWVWAPGGWLREMGALDFAGGTVVHVCSAATALAGVLVIGPRIGHRHEAMPPHNLPLTLLGAGLLWFGWFGFNAGSALAANGIAASAFVATHLAAAGATLTWVGAEWLHRGKATLLGAASGCIAGLVAVTPAAGFVGPMPALAIGLLAGALCYGAVVLKTRVGLDDSLDVIGIHGIGGALGALLTGVFASTLVNPDGRDGLLSGNPSQVATQALAVLVTVGYCFGVSLLLLRVCHGAVGLRVSSDAEIIGIDSVDHAERAYSLY